MTWFVEYRNFYADAVTVSTLLLQFSSRINVWDRFSKNVMDEFFFFGTTKLPHASSLAITKWTTEKNLEISSSSFQNVGRFYQPQNLQRSKVVVKSIDRCGEPYFNPILQSCMYYIYICIYIRTYYVKYGCHNT